MLIIVNFHYVRPSYDDLPFPAIHGITPDGFRRQLLMLGEFGRFVGLAQVCDAVAGGKGLPDVSLLVTFDDGLREQHEYAWPILQELDIPAVFFPNTRPIATSTVSVVHQIHLLRAHTPPGEFSTDVRRVAKERGIELPITDPDVAVAHYRYDSPDVAEVKYLLNLVLSPADQSRLVNALFNRRFNSAATSRQLYMDTDQLCELAAAGCLGSHSAEHLPVGQLDNAGMRAQVRESTEWLTAITGVAPRAFSFPYGSKMACNQKVAPVLAEHGYEFALTMERAANRQFDLPFALARFDNNDLPGGKASVLPAPGLVEQLPSATWFR